MGKVLIKSNFQAKVIITSDRDSFNCKLLDASRGIYQIFCEISNIILSCKNLTMTILHKLILDVVIQESLIICVFVFLFQQVIKFFLIWLDVIGRNSYIVVHFEIFILKVQNIDLCNSLRRSYNTRFVIQIEIIACCFCCFADFILRFLRLNSANLKSIVITITNFCLIRLLLSKDVIDDFIKKLLFKFIDWRAFFLVFGVTTSLRVSC